MLDCTSDDEPDEDDDNDALLSRDTDESNPEASSRCIKTSRLGLGNGVGAAMAVSTNRINRINQSCLTHRRTSRYLLHFHSIFSTLSDPWIDQHQDPPSPLSRATNRSINITRSIEGAQRESDREKNEQRKSTKNTGKPVGALPMVLLLFLSRARRRSLFVLLALSLPPPLLSRTHRPPTRSSTREEHSTVV